MADEKKNLEAPAVDAKGGGAPSRVVVGCKLQHGLAIDAETSPIRHPSGELVDSGDRDLGRRIVLNGTDSLTIKDTGFIVPDSGGYGITVLEGWQVEAWRDWYARHREFAPVKRGMIFEVADESEAKAEGRKRADVKSGAERIDPEKLPTGIQKADEKK